MQRTMKRFYKKEYYQRIKYDFNLRYPYLRVLAKTLVNKFSPVSALDIGCAKGYLVYALRELGVDAYGVDVSKYAIFESPHKVKGCLLNLDVDFEDLPFNHDVFDLVTALEVVEHLRETDHLISEMKRVLKKGGISLISTPPSKLRDLLVGMMIGDGYGILGHNPTHVNLHSRSFWIRKFKQYGFQFVGDFPKDALKSAIASYPPSGKIAEFLVRFGRTGKRIRDELALILTNPTLLFRLTNKTSAPACTRGLPRNLEGNRVR